MIIKSLMGSPVTIDGEPFVQDIEMNIPNNDPRLKVKLIYLNGDEKIPIGVLIDRYTLPELDLGSTGISITVVGSEYKRQIPFSLDIGYNFIKRTWFIKGYINYQPVDEQFKSMKEFPINMVTKYVK